MSVLAPTYFLVKSPTLAICRAAVSSLRGSLAGFLATKIEGSFELVSVLHSVLSNNAFQFCE